MSSFDRTIAEHRRLAILRVLSKAPGHSGNCSILTDATNHLGVAGTRDQVRGDMRWLDEQGLVTLEELRTLLVARITQAGLDVANGLSRRDGVKKPSPADSL